MEIVLVIVGVAVVVAFLVLVITTLRDGAVYRARSRIINLVGDINNSDIDDTYARYAVADKDGVERLPDDMKTILTRRTNARWKVYHRVSYDRMVYSFWKPVSRFEQDMIAEIKAIK